MKETTIDSTQIFKWIRTQPVMPRSRYIEPLIKDLSLTHTVPEQDFQIIQHTTSLTSTIHDEAQPLTNQTIKSAKQSQIFAPAEMNPKIESEEISSNLPVSDQPPDIPSEKTSKELSSDSPVSESITNEQPVFPFQKTDETLSNRNSGHLTLSKSHFWNRVEGLFQNFFQSPLRYLLIGGLVIAISLIWIISNNNLPKPDNDNVPTNEDKPKPDVAEKSEEILTPPNKYPEIKYPEIPTESRDTALSTKKTDIEMIWPTFKQSPKYQAWGEFYESGEQNRATALCVTPDNYIIVGGWAKEEERNEDALVFKLNAQNGTVLWGKNFGGEQDDSVRALAITTDGGIVIAGYKSYSSYNEPEKDLWIFKLEPQNGQKLWEKRFGDNQHDGAIAVDTLSNDDIIVAGWTDSFGRGKADGWILRLNSQTGDTIWDKTLGSSEADVIRAIQITPNDEILLAGATQSPYYHWNAWVLKLNKQGQQQWEKILGGDLETQARALQIMPDGDIVIAGYQKISATRKKAWLSRLSQNGNRQRWQKTWGHQGTYQANAIYRTADDGIIVAGYSNKLEAWLFKLDARGYQNWQYTIDGIEGKAFALTSTHDGALIVAGYGKMYGKIMSWVAKFTEE